MPNRRRSLAHPSVEESCIMDCYRTKRSRPGVLVGLALVCLALGSSAALAQSDEQADPADPTADPAPDSAPQDEADEAEAAPGSRDEAEAAPDSAPPGETEAPAASPDAAEVAPE